MRVRQRKNTSNTTSPHCTTNTKGNDNEDVNDLFGHVDTIDRDLTCCWTVLSVCQRVAWGTVYWLFITVWCVLLMFCAMWVVTEVQMMAEIYSVDCDGPLCRKPTHRAGVPKLPVCTRASAARCALLPANWVFPLALPIYQRMTGQSMWDIQEHFPMLLIRRCKLCFGHHFIHVH